MNILIPTLAVAFAAFCVWLTVRIINRRERWAMWTALAVALSVSLATLTWLDVNHRFKKGVSDLHFGMEKVPPPGEPST